MSIIEQLYLVILPIMKADGLEDTSVNRHAYLIGVRAAHIDSSVPQDDFQRYLIIEALTDEIIRLGDEIGIDDEGNPKQ